MTPRHLHRQRQLFVPRIVMCVRQHATVQWIHLGHKQMIMLVRRDVARIVVRISLEGARLGMADQHAILRIEAEFPRHAVDHVFDLRVGQLALGRYRPSADSILATKTKRIGARVFQVGKVSAENFDCVIVFAVSHMADETLQCLPTCPDALLFDDHRTSARWSATMTRRSSATALHSAMSTGSAFDASINVISLLAKLLTRTRSESTDLEAILPATAARPARRMRSDTVIPARSAALAKISFSSGEIRNLSSLIACSGFTGLRP